MEFPGGNENYLAITGTAHPFLSGAETFHTPSLGDEEFEIPPIALDADPSLAVADVVGHFDDLGDPVTAPDATFSAQYGVQALDIPVGISHSLMEQSGGLLSSGLSMDLDHPMGTQYSANPPVTIDVPMTDIGSSLMGHGQLTTIDQSELSSQLGLSLGGGSILPPAAQSPEERLSPTPSPASSMPEEEPEEIRRQVSVAKPTITASIAPMPVTLPAVVLEAAKKQKPTKKQKKKKDPNEPQKPVSAYALFFRDTQAAIKGQNPKATFGEVSKIVASMWDSLGEEQKQVYKRKTEAAKKEYLKALAAYRDNQECQTVVETAEPDPVSSPPEQVAPVVESTSPPAPVLPTPPSLESPPPPPTIVSTQPTVVVTSSTGPQVAGQTSITKIIIPKQMLPSSLAVSSQGGVVTVIPATMVTSRGIQLGQLQTGTGTTQIVTRSVLAAAAAAATSMHLPRLQPPPLQQMPQQPPTQPVTILQQPPPLQAMQQPPFQQKVRLNLQQPPPPLQIKILPPPALQIQPIALRTEEGSPERPSTELQTSPEAVDVVPEMESPTQMHVELVSESPVAMSPRPRCIRVGCDNPPVANSDWDNEYCSNECVVKHCRDVFLAWLASRNSNNNVVFVK
ncbi:TOX high mobility group box family member 4 isoform X1 [Anolis carolinensis]|uniref:TOX high mobility group box family member 4 n=1 Tax=Anolis carolinensis TaxID=28377 RepID=H9G6Y3_ANOCA|nr:PREDICTED: TOX high mobility group box family member 4 isoform X1 [Anolis carolinensis]|eukprot:XP_008118616.1 PREDICTED: TOX high mobility group box family member 4 isoform X1 [Anolis carolinensis]